MYKYPLLRDINSGEEEFRKAIDSAEEEFRRAIELDPKDPSPHINLALLLRTHRKDLKGAEAEHRHAIELDPRNSISRCNFGFFLMNHKKDLENAEQEYRIAMGLDPLNAYAHWNLSIVLEKREDLRGAIGSAKGYIAAGNPGGRGEQRIEALRAKMKRTTTAKEKNKEGRGRIMGGRGAARSSSAPVRKRAAGATPRPLW
jgi:Flp pilus assembly protein TadD